MISPVYITPNIERLLIVHADDHPYSLVHDLLRPLSLGTSLRDVRLHFSHLTDDYLILLRSLAKTVTSFHTMTFEIEKDGYSDEEHSYLQLDPLLSLHWPRTDRLTIGVRYPYEILLLLEKNALPLLEHLDVTIKGCQLEDDLYRRAPQTIRFSEENIRQMVNVIHLRTFVVRQLTLKQVIMFLRSLHFPMLDQLTLTDIFDSTLKHCEQFLQSFDRVRFPVLRSVSFLVVFPVQFCAELQTTVLPIFNGSWPFGHLAIELDERRVLQGYSSNGVQAVILFYTPPLNAVLWNTEILSNRSFAKHPLGIRRRSLVWTCTETDGTNPLIATVAKQDFDHLDLCFIEVERSIVCHSAWIKKTFLSLRSVTVHSAPECISDSHRADLLDQILAHSFRLEYLTVQWNVLRRCSTSNINVRDLFLRLGRSSSDPNRFLDVEHLGHLLPNLRSLQTSAGHLALNDHLIRFIVQIVETFPRLFQLILNGEGTVPLRQDNQLNFERAIFQTEHPRLTNLNLCRINFPQKNTVLIWFA